LADGGLSGDCGIPAAADEFDAGSVAALGSIAGDLSASVLSGGFSVGAGDVHAAPPRRKSTKNEAARIFKQWLDMGISVKRFLHFCTARFLS
jgi:hypothetical protein